MSGEYRDLKSQYSKHADSEIRMNRNPHEPNLHPDIDTNILVDLILARQEFLPDAQRVFALGYAGEVQLTVSALSFVNTVYLARKYKYTLDEVYSKLRLVAEFVDVADLCGQNVIGHL